MRSGGLDAGVQNYRAYHYNWIGFPNKETAIVALDDGKETKIFVSWNGDTETIGWQFMEHGAD